MAQTLREGCTYSLITEQENNEKRQVYFVKLTDSCLKAIEEHTHELKIGSKMKSIIRFDDAQSGVVSIPSKYGSLQEIDKKFNFAISNVLTSENNPLQECIKQYNWNSDKLLSYGPLEQKISIAATDDCYENTRNRMAQVDQERKDVRTKEIKLSNMKKGKKCQNKVVAPDVHKLTAIKNIKKMNHYTLNSPKPSVTSSTNHGSPAVLPKKSPIPTTRKSPTSSTNRNSPSIGGKSFTCRERVIHILSLRPHKKPELISRLQKEAMSQKDRNNLAMVLQQVSSHSDNHYALLPQFYADLQIETWPFYSESEKSIVKNNITANKKVDPTSPQLVSSTSKSPEEKLPKRPSLVNNGHINKKLKVETSEEPSSTSISPSKISDDKTNLNTSSPVRNKESKSHGEESPPTVASTSDSPEYLLSYKPITSREQRFQYKRDFQMEYPEYINLKNKLDAVATKFIELDGSLRKTAKGSVEYVRIHEEIMTAYNRQQQDEKYHRMKCRCEELHQKLSHIKRLVVEYDNQMVNS